MFPCIDKQRFKGFAVLNFSGKYITITVVKDSSDTKREFIKECVIESGEVYYAEVGEVIRINPPGWTYEMDSKYDNKDTNKILRGLIKE